MKEKQGQRRSSREKESEHTKPTAEAIGDIERTLKGGRIVVYVQDWTIGPWDVMPMFSRLSELGKVKELYLILDGLGGYPDDAFKIANIIHEFCETLIVVVPFKAKSAATLLSLAGQKILMSPVSELGPCDPMISVDELLITPSGVPLSEPAAGNDRGKRKKRQMNALALRDFLEVAGVVKKGKTGDTLEYDCEKLMPYLEKGVLNPWLLGDFERSFKQACQFVECLLERYMFEGDAEKQKLIPEITRKLAEGYYLHAYPISRREAQTMGLSVEDMDETLWAKTSELMAAYDKMKRDQKICTIIETSQSYYVDYWDT